MECRGVVAPTTNAPTPITDLVVLSGRALAAARGVHRAEHARGAHPLRRARCRRRLRRERPRLSRGIAHSVPRARRETAGAVDRGPARAFHVRLPFARPDPRCRGGLRRRRPAARIPRQLHCRLRRLESDRRRHRLQHRGASARAVQVRQLRRPRSHRRDQQGAERALSRRRTAGGHIRDGADDGPHRRRARVSIRPTCGCAT